jgi:hypothetical protein
MVATAPVDARGRAVEVKTLAVPEGGEPRKTSRRPVAAEADAEASAEAEAEVAHVEWRPRSPTIAAENQARTTSRPRLKT